MLRKFAQNVPLWNVLANKNFVGEKRYKKFMTFNFRFIFIRFKVNEQKIVLSAVVVIFYEIKYHANSVFKVINYFRHLSAYGNYCYKYYYWILCQNSAKLSINSWVTLKNKLKQVLCLFNFPFRELTKILTIMVKSLFGHSMNVVKSPQDNIIIVELFLVSIPSRRCTCKCSPHLISQIIILE